MTGWSASLVEDYLGSADRRRCSGRCLSGRRCKRTGDPGGHGQYVCWDHEWQGRGAMVPDAPPVCDDFQADVGGAHHWCRRCGWRADLHTDPRLEPGVSR